jgi:hypothetical protein
MKRKRIFKIFIVTQNFLAVGMFVEAMKREFTRIFPLQTQFLPWFYVGFTESCNTDL